MPTEKVSKEDLIEIIERLEKNPDDRVGSLGDLGITAVGAVGAGATAAILGGTVAPIPIFTALTGIGMAVAAPAVIVAGAAVAGGAAVYGISRLIKDGGFNDGKRQQLLIQYKEQLRDIRAKEKQSSYSNEDKAKFYSLLKIPLQADLIDPTDMQELMQAVEDGHLSLVEAYKLIEPLLLDSSVTQNGFHNSLKPRLLESRKKQLEKMVTTCPNCSQNLRAPVALGKLNLTCPKCHYAWLWTPKQDSENSENIVFNVICFIIISYVVIDAGQFIRRLF